MIRVLHVLDEYLHVSENWLYPQIVGVPGVDTKAFARSANAPHVFPLQPGRLVVDCPPWNETFGLPRLLSAVARRVGCRNVLARRKLGHWKPDLLHAHFGMRGWDYLGWKEYFDAPLVTSFYGYDAWLLPRREPVWNERYRQLFEGGDVFLVEGPAMAQRLSSLGCPEEKIIVQRIGVDLECLPFRNRDYGEGLRILMVGRFVEKKGMVDGLRACALARSRGVDLRVTIVGDAAANDPAGSAIKAELQSVAAEAGLAGHVQFRGFVPLEKTRALYLDHNVFLCPSKHAANGDAEGGSPVVLTETMASGMLCVGTRHCDIPELILHAKTGLSCDEGDVHTLSEILVGLPARPEQLAKLAKAGREHVSENFSLHHQMVRLGQVYEQIHDSTRPAPEVAAQPNARRLPVQSAP